MSVAAPLSGDALPQGRNDLFHSINRGEDEVPQIVSVGKRVRNRTSGASLGSTRLEPTEWFVEFPPDHEEFVAMARESLHPFAVDLAAC